MTAAAGIGRWPDRQGDGRYRKDGALFVYGSLPFPEVLVTLIDRVPDRRPAMAEGWRAAAIPNEVYPGLVPGESIVRGYLLTGLTPEEWRLLDAFESPFYELKRVELTDGSHGWAYACTPDVVGPEDWSAEQFEAQHLAAFAERCAAWRGGYEVQE
ncbi:gamma-glutamylcyclotransferase family protein [Actinomadura sp. B10D3]|uniref:gamma-glutamylcyclotransferase family protein n=1 Tax=Actinomadura sp. B10D3 TaxID=3153557 RepID=UPI00325D8698